MVTYKEDVFVISPTSKVGALTTDIMFPLFLGMFWLHLFRFYLIYHESLQPTYFYLVAECFTLRP